MEVKDLREELKEKFCPDCNYQLRHTWEHGVLHIDKQGFFWNILNRIFTPNGQCHEWVCDNCYNLWFSSCDGSDLWGYE